MIPFPNKKYQIIYADPPWEVKAGPGWASNGKSRNLVYPTMTLEEIKHLPVKDISDKECILFLWTINKYIEQSYQITRFWGFKPSTLLIWCKNPNGIGLGGTFSLTTEYLLFAWKGKCGAEKRYDTTWWIEKRGRHSEKPKLFRDIIDKTFTNKTKIELFARQKTEGWDVWGNEV
uniref:Putative methyltransferase n=1 Tax=viral metagenome TaxID=1070528 RepID=A0A6M3L1D4_9ZZZZ